MVELYQVLRGDPQVLHCKTCRVTFVTGRDPKQTIALHEENNRGNHPHASGEKVLVVLQREEDDRLVTVEEVVVDWRRIGKARIVVRGGVRYAFLSMSHGSWLIRAYFTTGEEVALDEPAPTAGDRSQATEEGGRPG